MSGNTGRDQRATSDSQRLRQLYAFIAGPGSSEAIHEAVLAVKTKVPIDVLADTIHAFPTTARVLGSLFVTAARKLEVPRVRRPPER